MTHLPWMALVSRPMSVKRGVGWRHRGVTLIELMVSVSIMAILLTIAVPGFQEFMLANRLRSAADDLAASAIMARSEALKRNANVLLCVSSDGSTCDASADWEDGWAVVTGGTALSSHGTLRAGYVVATNTGTKSITFPPSGVGVTAVTLRVCFDGDPDGSQEREVVISTSGTPTVIRTQDGTCP